MYKRKFDNIILFLSIVVISGASIIEDSNYSMLLFNAILFVLTKKERLLNPKIWGFIGITIIINFLTIFIFSTQTELLRIINFILSPILFSFLLLTYFGLSFWEKLEIIVYKLSILSLIIYPLNVLFPNFFSSMWDVFRHLTSSMFKDYHYWTSLFYVHCIDLTHSTIYEARNSGFMWEPGAFSYILILMISFNLIKSNVNFRDRKFIIYSIALLTTFSTSGYIAYFVIILTAIISKYKSVFVYVVAFFLIVGALIIYQNVDFLGSKIDGYFGSYERDYTNFVTEGFNAAKLDRFLFFKYQLIEVLNYPFGYGVFRPTDIESMWNFVGVNGLSDLLFTFGFPVFIFMQFYTYSFFKVFYKNKFNLMIIGIYAANLISLFSNPLARSPITFLIFFTPFIFSKKDYLIYEYFRNINLPISRGFSSNK